ncbi:MAG: ribose 5-phosphate isomerase B [Bacteroidaceae bacterium]|nr:ribose 5-phosphate isomerase B [Bacteroidaceae bacterium]
MTDRETIAVASDHAGYAMKEYAKRLLAERGFDVLDLGTDNEQSCDYPDYAHALASAIEDGRVRRGVAACGSGEGMAMTLNKHAAVRAALVWSPDIAEMTRRHNDANVLVLPGRYMSEAVAADCIAAFLDTAFEGGRHQRRIEKMAVRH